MEAKKRSVEIISTTMIKPSSPTPQHKRHLKLSLLDQTFSTVYGSVIFFYTAPTKKLFNTYSLQKSLSKALELFYPFAGKLSDDLTCIECNDQGAYFLEARINCELSHFLRNPDPKTVTEFLPSYDPKTLDNAVTNNVFVLVQVSFFSCGGVAVAVEVSHKIADGSSVACFAKEWAAISAAGAQEFAPPVFVASSLLPPTTLPIKRVVQSRKTALRSRRFVFNSAKLSDLKAKIQGENGVVNFNPSTLEAVSSLLFKCAVAASGPSGFLQMVDLRKRLTPSLAQNNVGNFAWPLIVSSVESKHPMELHDIAIAMRRGLSEFSRDCKDNDRLKGEALLSMVLGFAEDEAKLAEAGVALCWFSALSSFRPYETDFGWGKPAWVTTPIFFKNRFPMLHSKSGRDIEVWATLEEKVMEKFESNEQLLAFASVDVPISATGHCRM